MEAQIIEVLCGRCQGSGTDPHWRAVCCQRSDWECGGRGCTGPEPMQEPCQDCGGYGKVPDWIEPVSSPQPTVPSPTNESP